MSRLADFFLGKVEEVNPPPGFKFHVSKTILTRDGSQVYRLGLYPADARVDEFGMVHDKRGRVVREFFPEVNFVMSEADTDRQIAKLRRRVLALPGEKARRDEHNAAAIKRVEG